MPSDLVKDSELETSFCDNYVQHVCWTQGVAIGRRKMRIVERWKTSKLIGAGAYGQVWLETCEGNHEPKLRATKIIRKKIPGSGFIDYNREIEAIAKFSHPKARTSTRLLSDFAG